MGNPSGLIWELKREALISTLEEWNGNRTISAEKLGVSIRTVRNWIKLFNLSERYPAPERFPELNQEVSIDG